MASSSPRRPGGGLALAVLLLLGGRAAAQGAPPTPSPTNGVFHMTDEEFWTAPTKGYDALFEEAVHGRSPRLVIDAPRVVDLGARSSLPVPIFWAFPRKDAPGVQLLRDATVVVSRLEDRACWAATVRRAVGEDEEEVPDPADLEEDPDAQRDPDEIVDQFLVTDLRQTPLIPWEPGTYEVRVVVRERQSNVVRTVLKGGAAPPAAKPAAASPPAGATLPSYAKRDDSPALPAQAGIAFEVPAQVAANDAQALLRVSFRLPVLPGDVAGTTAFVPLHLVLVGAEDGESLLLRLRVPVTAPAAGALATGHATLDLLELHRPLQGGKTRTFLVRAVSGDVVAGPAPLKLVR